MRTGQHVVICSYECGTRLITVLQSQVIVLDVKVDVRKNELSSRQIRAQHAEHRRLTHLLADLLPNDPRHLVAVQLDDWVLHSNLAVAYNTPSTSQTTSTQNHPYPTTSSSRRKHRCALRSSAPATAPIFPWSAWMIAGTALCVESGTTGASSPSR